MPAFEGAIVLPLMSTIVSPVEASGLTAPFIGVPSLVTRPILLTRSMWPLTRRNLAIEGWNLTGSIFSLSASESVFGPRSVRP